MAKDRNGSTAERLPENEAEEENDKKRRTSRESSDSDSGEESDGKLRKSRRRAPDSSDSDEERRRRRRRRRDGERKKGKSRRRHSSEDDDSESESESESEGERRRRRRKRRREREEDEERERKRKRKKRREREEKEKMKKKKQKEKKERGSRGAVTNTWGKYGIIRETDMWNKRPEFTAWLAEVKQVNLESLPNWEEKQMFKAFMEDHNTATFPSKKYYNLDAYYKQQMEKEMKRGFKKVSESERTVFNDEEQRRQELQREREKQKEEEVEALKRSMQGGMAQAMKEQAQLREEMAYQYKLGNFEAAAAIQRRLDPDAPA